MGMKFVDCVVLCNVGINILFCIENGNDNCIFVVVFVVLYGLGIKFMLFLFEKWYGLSVSDDEWV